MDDRLMPDGADGPPEKEGTGPATAVLVIGLTDHATLAQASVLGGSICEVPIGGLNAALLARLFPDWVVFPLIAPDFDAPTVIETLAELGYSGRVCVVSPPLPNRRMVEIELRSIASVMHVMLVERPG